MKNKLFKVEINATWFVEAECETDAEQEAVDVFCLDDVPPCCTFNIDTVELVTVDSLKEDTTLVTLSKVAEMVYETNSRKLLVMLLELVRTQVCSSDEEFILSTQLQKKINEKLGAR